MRRATDQKGIQHPPVCISIHALLAESDHRDKLQEGRNSQFLSTLSLRRATLPTDGLFFWVGDFYPRSPCGERPVQIVIIVVHALFLSTLSLRRATWPGLLARPFFLISIHALLAESDTDGLYFFDRRKNFYPRSPCGERRAPPYNLMIYHDFYPRSPCGERPPLTSRTKTIATDFYPRSPCGERRLHFGTPRR